MENIENLLVKYLNQASTADELDILNEWIKNPENKEIFKSYIESNYSITLALVGSDFEKTLEYIGEEIRKQRKIQRNYKAQKILKYAAVVIIVFSSFLFLKNKQEREFPFLDEQIMIKENDIILELGNGKIKVISDNGNEILTDTINNIVVMQKESKLVYNKNSSQNILSYNTLSIPNGKRFKIRLSDGTIVHLNSGSSLKYPVQFLKGKERKVHLKGEAYFDVAYDESDRFIVEAQHMNVGVYGTQFNVNAYPDESTEQVVLVEGAVQMNIVDAKNGESDKIMLRPGVMGTFDFDKNEISTQKVDPKIHTAWLNGNLVFQNSTAEMVVKKLQRNYGVTIINRAHLDGESFNGRFNIEEETIEDIMEYFTKIYDLEFEVIENIIIIK